MSGRISIFCLIVISGPGLLMFASLIQAKDLRSIAGCAYHEC